MLDWGISATITALIAFGYSIWVESKLKKLNDRVAEYEKKLEEIEALASAPAAYKEKPLTVHRVGVPAGGDFSGGLVDE